MDKSKPTGNDALDSVKTKQKLEAGEQARKAAAVDPHDDSPKRQGDKLEKARDAAAGVKPRQG